MTLPPSLPHPNSLLQRSARATFSLPAVAPSARPASARVEPVLRADRASRQLNLPFFAPLAPRGR